MTQPTRTQINGHFVNTCNNDDLRFIALYLKVTPKQYSTYSNAGRAKLLAYIGTKLANLLAGLNVDYIELDNLPSDLAPKQPEPEVKANPFGKAKASKKAGTPRPSKLAGAYTIIKDGRGSSKARPSAIYDALFSCTTFEEFFAKAPAKEIFAGKLHEQSVNTATASVGYALRNGWIAVAV
jgi:hypothetical protein